MTVLSGLGATATAIAAVVGLLTQFGWIGSRGKTNATPVAAVATTAAASPAPTKAILQQQVSALATAAPQVAAATPRPHHRHKLKNLSAEELIAGAPVPRTVMQASRAAATPKAVAMADAAPAVPLAAAPAASPAAQPSVAMIEPAKPLTLTGAWRDGGIGACHLINQSGNSFELTNFDPTTGEIMGHGMGSIDGNHVEITFPRGRVLIDLHVSPDGTTMYGKVTRPAGVFRAMWFYIGPQCSKTS